MANFLTNWGLTRKQIIMVCVFMFGSFVTILNQTIVAPALPTIMIEMSIDAAKAQWLTTGFTLVNAIMIPITAYLIDRFATRSLFLVSMTLFTFGQHWPVGVQLLTSCCLAVWFRRRVPVFLCPWS